MATHVGQIDQDAKGPSKLNDSVLLAIFSLPYLYDFIVGIVSFVFLMKIAEFNDKHKTVDFNQENQNLLVIIFN